ncbi:MAG: tyrosine-type recombinase/integrase [Ferruginibacter sp.]|nr:tyrosine-type recombinase/integrase [Ferruginibacter sp.]
MKAWHIADTQNHRLEYGIPVENNSETNNKFNIAHNKSLATLSPINEIKNTKTEILLKPITTKTNKLFIGIYFKFNETINNKIIQLNNIKYSNSNKCWYLPCNKIAYHNLSNAIATIADTAQLNTTKLSAYLKSIKAKKNNNPQPNQTNITIYDKIFAISAHNLQILVRTEEHLKLKAYSPSTIRTYKNEIASFLQTLKNHKANTLTSEDLRRYIHYCITKLNLSENTVHSRLNALKYMYEQVLGHQKFFVEIPRPKKHLQLPKVLGEQELRRLFNAPKNLKHKAILFIAYSAGLRVSEVINLRLQDIDRERKQIFIYCSKGKKDRYVMLSPLVLDVLEQYYKLSYNKPTNYLFEGIEKGQPYSIRSAQQIFNDAKRSAGIIKTLSFHSLRHSFATHLLEKGVDVIFIKDILGHFNIKTTERYLHVRRETLINIPSPIDELYNYK